MFGQTFTIFDTETTGFYATKGDRIIEVAAVKIQDGKVVEGMTFERLINPEREVPYESTAISGITNEMVQSAPTMGEVFPDFLSFIEGTYLVAHNAKFDMSFFDEELFQWNPFERSGHLGVVCTKQLSKRVFPKEKFHNLDIIAHRYGIPKVTEGRHRALPDVLLLAEVFQKLVTDAALPNLEALLEAGKMG